MTKQEREHQFATQIAQAKNRGHHSTVSQLQTYVLGNTFIKIYDLDNAERPGDSDKVPSPPLGHPFLSHIASVRATQAPPCAE